MTDKIMNKILLIAAFFIAFSSIISAQTTFPARIRAQRANFKAQQSSLADTLIRPEQTFSVIPLPASITPGKGDFVLSTTTTLIYNKKDNGLRLALSPLAATIQQLIGKDPMQEAPVSSRKRPSLAKNRLSPSSIEVAIDGHVHSSEGYQLVIRPARISLKAGSPTGIFYGVQTLLQLLQEPEQQPRAGRATENGLAAPPLHWSLPCLSIIDSPRFAYRGVMLDVARHYMPIEFIQKLIDLLAMQKMNRLHLHLTDSQGWRFESKKYPKLTQIGAWRKGTPLNTTYDYNSRPQDSLYGGYYTQQQLRDLVRYAEERFVTIIPEIEMPAHSKSALAAYPEYACLDSTGKPFPAPAQVQDEYCTKDATFQFLTDILSEVMDIFPSHYIHVAGDEASKVNWKTCPLCRKRMQAEGLKNEEELQSYFITRIEKFVNSKGRSIIGWDEILQGGLAPNATVMSWTGIEGGIKAAKMHHTVVMTPGEYCYFDHYQSDAPGEPVAFGGLTKLAKVYSYDPIPAELTKEEAGYILGAQGNLWTEYIPTPTKAEYMIFPRAIALAEVDWSDPSKKDYSNFITRLTRYLKKLDDLKVNYSHHMFDITLRSGLNAAGEVIVTLGGVTNSATTTRPEGSFVIHYTLDGSTPTAQSPLYTEPIVIKKSSTLTAAVLATGGSTSGVAGLGKEAANNFIYDQLKKAFILHKAVGRPVVLQTPPDRAYNKGGDAAWVNGSLGNDDRFQDEDWLGWNDKAFNGTIDFGKATTFSTLHTRFFHKPSSWIWMPRKITIQVSSDGATFTTLAEKEISLPSGEGAAPVELSFPATTARWLRIIAEPYGLIPKSSPGEGYGAWLFVDEMVIE